MECPVRRHLAEGGTRFAMRTHPGMIFMADWLLVRSCLGVQNADERLLVWQLLGLASQVPEPGTEQNLAHLAPSQAAAPQHEPVLTRKKEALDDRPLPTSVSQSHPMDSETLVPSWIKDMVPVQAGVERQSVNLRALEPLLRPKWARAIMIQLLSLGEETRMPDVDRVVELIATARPLSSLPRLRRATLSEGVQVLVDRSDSLLPFFADQAWLTRLLRHLVGEHSLEILDFAGCPWRDVESGETRREVGVGGSHRWRVYRTPRRGVPILLLTDLGIGRSRQPTDWATVSEWLVFLALTRKARCPVVTLVPYPKHRWPERLAKAMPILVWDRETGTPQVKAVVYKRGRLYGQTRV